MIEAQQPVCTKKMIANKIQKSPKKISKKFFFQKARGHSTNIRYKICISMNFSRPENVKVFSNCFQLFDLVRTRNRSISNWTWHETSLRNDYLQSSENKRRMRAHISASKISLNSITQSKNSRIRKIFKNINFRWKKWSSLFWYCKYREAREEAGESGESALQAVVLDKDASISRRQSTRLEFHHANRAILVSSADKDTDFGRNGDRAVLMPLQVLVKLESEIASTAQKEDQSK